MQDRRKRRRPYYQKNRPQAEVAVKEPVKLPASEYEAPEFILPEEYKLPCETADTNEYEVIGIKFDQGGKMYYFDPDKKQYKPGTFAVVDTARGMEFGEVVQGNKTVLEREVVLPLRKALRTATEEDIAHKKENDKKEKEAFVICEEMIRKHELEMKLVETEYTFDNTKLLFYFTSDSRVDFRELVKDLASVFRTRIELRQIGIRDEAKMMGGLGICGRPFCCRTFLDGFVQVSIKMAKEQNLSLNAAKISGTCGRLMCCLRYEHDVYEEEIRKTPKVDSLVRTDDGDGVITEISPLQGTVKVRLSGLQDAPPKTYKREDVKVMGYVKKEKQTGKKQEEEIPEE